MEANLSDYSFKVTIEDFKVTVKHSSDDFYVYFTDKQISVSELKDKLCNTKQEYHLIQFCTPTYPDGYYVFDTENTINGSKKFVEKLNNELVSCIYVVPNLKEKSGKSCSESAYKYVENLFNICQSQNIEN